MEQLQKVPKTQEEQERDERIFSALGYLPPLFFIPLYFGTKSEYAMWHGRQGIIITILSVVGGVLGPVVALLVPIIGGTAVMAYNVWVFIIMILGAWNAFHGKRWGLPWVGKFAKEFEK